jgi:hypothetical protein
MASKVLGMHHIGITVPNIEEGIAFFKAVFGAIDVFRTGPFDVDNDFMSRKLGAAFVTSYSCVAAMAPASSCLSIAAKASLARKSARQKWVARIFVLKWRMSFRQPSVSSHSVSRCWKARTQ